MMGKLYYVVHVLAFHAVLALGDNSVYGTSLEVDKNPLR